MGTDRHENYTISLGFSRANRGAPDTARDAVLLREQRPYLRTSRFQGHELLQRKDNSSRVLRRRLRVRLRYRTWSRRTYLRVRDRLTHVQLLFTWNPSPASVLKVSLEYLLLPPRSAPVAAPGGLTPGTFNARHRDPPTHCGVNLHEGSSAVAARYRPNAGASSIFRASCFGR
ncbi:hypothetical protein JTE90_027251 [Oedothorax gibbosus]|uniref:Uncharacterized protein n=1 Tax=Oedothorax gibbosus TaxID=931172 RepID=A0AAV6TG69_9ARAC|nr:hypothetical protein JTE90_027251 [Oedothorax gibbosus]